jgi:hypothetical protein
VSNPEEEVPDIEELPKNRKLGFPVNQLEKGETNKSGEFSTSYTSQNPWTILRSPGNMRIWHLNPPIRNFWYLRVPIRIRLRRSM